MLSSYEASGQELSEVYEDGIRSWRRSSHPRAAEIISSTDKVPLAISSTLCWDSSTDFSIAKVWDGLRVHKHKVSWHRLVLFPGHNTPRITFVACWFAVGEKLSTKARLHQWGENQ